MTLGIVCLEALRVMSPDEERGYQGDVAAPTLTQPPGLRRDFQSSLDQPLSRRPHERLGAVAAVAEA